MPKIGWDDQPPWYTAWDRIRDERREKPEHRPGRCVVCDARVTNPGDIACSYHRTE